MTTDVQLTDDAYRRWLRAWRPPFAWFLGLPETEQEALAQLGDGRSEDLAVAVGYAVADPQLADAAVSGDDAGTEEALALRLAADVAVRLAQGTQKRNGAPAKVSPGSTPKRAPRAPLFGGST